MPTKQKQQRTQYFSAVRESRDGVKVYFTAGGPENKRPDVSGCTQVRMIPVHRWGNFASFLEAVDTLERGEEL